jgi:predicted glycosyltransferase involved in capsule biosynthesis
VQLISIVVPLGPNEKKWKTLAYQLSLLPEEKFELIFVACSDKHFYLLNKILKSFVYLKTFASRARQLNLGASRAKGEFVWFLHADSYISYDVIKNLIGATRKYKNSLCYFHLKFYDKPHLLIILNEWGAWLRSCVFKVPFGDQGFFINKSVFSRLSGFCEKCSYGEDHLFVWKAHHASVPLQVLDASLYTSARKYQHYGWTKLTLVYQYLWIKQALPQWIKKWNKT